MRTKVGIVDHRRRTVDQQDQREEEDEEGVVREKVRIPQGQNNIRPARVREHAPKPRLREMLWLDTQGVQLGAKLRVVVEQKEPEDLEARARLRDVFDGILGDQDIEAVIAVTASQGNRHLGHPGNR